MWNERIAFLMIDEYQDTNRTQYEMARLLSAAHNNVCAVGDEDQSIYSWRGADIRNILDFERDFPNAVTIRLEQNYRSTKNILEAASTVIANNRARKGKWLWTESGAGARIKLYQAPDSENEALYIADTINRTVQQQPNTRVAVLYRTNSQSRQIEEALRRYRLTYNIVGGLSFYQRAEIKDVLSYLKLLLVPTDPVSLTRIINVPARGIGKTTVEQIEAHAREHRITLWQSLVEMLDQRRFPSRAEAAVAAFRRLVEELREMVERAVPLGELLGALVERTGYVRMLEQDKTPGAENRVDNVNELLNAAADAAERGEGLAEFLDHAALVADADNVDEKSRISLLTVHNAKGLEFPVVILAGMEEGLFPHSRSFDSESMMEEERRLCYVGMTRAEQRLIITNAMLRRRYGGSPLEPAIASRFLAEIPAQLCDLEGSGRGGGGSRYRPQQQQESGDDAGAWLDRHGFGRRGEVDLFAERSYVRQSVTQTAGQIRQKARESQEHRQQQQQPPPPAAAGQQPYAGKTYNSVENIADYFRDRGIRTRSMQERQQPSPPTPPAAMPPSQQLSRPAAGPQGVSPARPPVARQPKKLGEGSTVHHPKYGRGTILRKEGDGDDAKLTVIFQGHGMKKLIAKFAGFTNE
jgi:DNA helicase-2/ATP-dependent DNA helicase PcrA